MSQKDYIKELESALVDVLLGNSRPYEIVEQTGLTEERAKEISDLYQRINANYQKKHGIS